jgi:glycine cleavage system H lipoate-binding protein
LQNATNHLVAECNSEIEEVCNRSTQLTQSSPLARAHRNNLPHLLVWYAECLKKSVKRDATKRWQSKKPSDARQEAVMTVLLVLMMFAIFLTIDFFYSKAKHPVLQVAPAMRKQDAAAARLRPSLVGGFSVPDNLRYHPGHTWALSESPNLVRIGIDDFASKLTGKVEHIALPQRGQWIRQGQKVWSIVRNGVKVDMVSPIEGSVADINEAVVNDPALATKDPYGEGWLVTVQSPDAKTNFRNLLGGAMARWWTEESSMRLQRVMPSALGVLAHDGGVAIDDLASTMPDEQWTKITREFFLT